jgi:hypothetical protein
MIKGKLKSSLSAKKSNIWGTILCSSILHYRTEFKIWYASMLGTPKFCLRFVNVTARIYL